MSVSVREILKKSSKDYMKTLKASVENSQGIFPLITNFVTGSFPYPLKTSENLWFSEGRERDQWHQMG